MLSSKCLNDSRFYESYVASFEQSYLFQRILKGKYCSFFFAVFHSKQYAIFNIKLSLRLTLESYVASNQMQVVFVININDSYIIQWKNIQTSRHPTSFNVLHHSYVRCISYRLNQIQKSIAIKNARREIHMIQSTYLYITMQQNVAEIIQYESDFI